MRFLTLFALVLPSAAFQCFSCNSEPDDDDSQPCIDQIIECPDDVESCSMVIYLSGSDDSVHLRKFCTSPGTPIYQYLSFFPQSAICQTIDTVRTDNEISFFPSLRRHRRDAMPPAPPRSYKNNLLCVCSTPLCNGGTYKQVIERTMLTPLHISDSIAPLSLQDLDN
uniref:UPAR/Ly6 domain-containing protein n=1 Tax=Ascaris lumbricoides TaxID=6252 RepID=A0A0M3I826_ASCLU